MCVSRDSGKKSPHTRKVQRIRTCIATRTTHPDTELLRVYARKHTHAPEVEIVPDPQRRHGGRGAWILPTHEAVERAVKRDAFRRSLRISAPVDIGLLRAYIAHIYD